jgi:uncharacterized SAM-binding protein YcdF (DUF218 family)
VRAAGALVLAGALVVLGVLGVRGLGPWLVVSDDLVPARAIVVLGGRVPFRAMEGAAIYGQGWAPEVWLLRTGASAEDSAFQRLGIDTGEEVDLNRTVLKRLAVPARAIRVFDSGVGNTVAELDAVVAELRRGGGSAVIIVTSKSHTRRVRTIWRAAVGQRPAAIVRYPADDPFHADRWWRYTGDALDVSREVFGLLNVWAGFPVRSDRGE